MQELIKNDVKCVYITTDYKYVIEITQMYYYITGLLHGSNKRIINISIYYLDLLIFLQYLIILIENIVLKLVLLIEYEIQQL